MFFDPQFSIDGSVSCVAVTFLHVLLGRQRPSARGASGTRNVPALSNVVLPYFLRRRGSNSRNAGTGSIQEENEFHLNIVAISDSLANDESTALPVSKPMGKLHHPML